MERGEGLRAEGFGLGYGVLPSVWAPPHHCYVYLGLDYGVLPSVWAPPHHCDVICSVCRYLAVLDAELLSVGHLRGEEPISCAEFEKGSLEA